MTLKVPTRSKGAKARNKLPTHNHLLDENDHKLWTGRIAAVALSLYETNTHTRYSTKECLDEVELENNDWLWQRNSCSVMIMNGKRFNIPNRAEERSLWELSWFDVGMTMWFWHSWPSLVHPKLIIIFSWQQATHKKWGLSWQKNQQ